MALGCWEPFFKSGAVAGARVTLYIHGVREKSVKKRDFAPPFIFCFEVRNLQIAMYTYALWRELARLRTSSACPCFAFVQREARGGITRAVLDCGARCIFWLRGPFSF